MGSSIVQALLLVSKRRKHPYKSSYHSVPISSFRKIDLNHWCRQTFFSFFFTIFISKIFWTRVLFHFLFFLILFYSIIFYFLFISLVFDEIWELNSMAMTDNVVTKITYQLLRSNTWKNFIKSIEKKSFFFTFNIILIKLILTRCFYWKKKKNNNTYDTCIFVREKFSYI